MFCRQPVDDMHQDYHFTDNNTTYDILYTSSGTLYVTTQSVLLVAWTAGGVGKILKGDFRQ